LNELLPPQAFDTDRQVIDQTEISMFGNADVIVERIGQNELGLWPVGGEDQGIGAILQR